MTDKEFSFLYKTLDIIIVLCYNSFMLKQKGLTMKRWKDADIELNDINHRFSRFTSHDLSIRQDHRIAWTILRGIGADLLQLLRASGRSDGQRVPVDGDHRTTVRRMILQQFA